MLDVDVVGRRGVIELSASFSCPAGVTAIFGPSGAGKTSLLRAISGLWRPNHAHVALNDEVLTSTLQGRYIPPHRRKIGYVFQEPRLFPHMTVLENIRYGGQGDQARVIETLGLEPLLTRGPMSLSGGEQQRVALARTLLSAPQALLLDEPLSALDDERKGGILPYIERLKTEFPIPIVYVSHSMREVYRLVDQIIVLNEGTVSTAGGLIEKSQDGSLRGFTPYSEWGSILEGRLCERDKVRGVSYVNVQGTRIAVSGLSSPLGKHLRLKVPALDIVLAPPNAQITSAQNCLPAVIESVALGEQDGTVTVLLSLGHLRIWAVLLAYSVQALGLKEGAPCKALFSAIDLR